MRIGVLAGLVGLARLAGASPLSHAHAALAAGRPKDALAALDAAIEINRDPVLLFSRATALVALGRLDSALEDLADVIHLKPSHAPARTQRSRILLMLGRIDAAAKESLAYPIHDQDFQKLKNDVADAQRLSSRYRLLVDSGNCPDAIDAIAPLLALCPLATEPRIARADCLLATGNPEAAAADLRRVLKVIPDASRIAASLANTLLAIGDLDDALATARDCLHADPDHKDCKRIYRQAKALDKGLKSIQLAASKGKWRDITNSLFGQNNLMHDFAAPKSQPLLKIPSILACKAYKGIKKDAETIEWCTKAINLDPENIDILITRAEAHINQAEYQEAINDYRRAHDINPNDPRIGEGHQRAQTLLKRAGIRDYYKILNVARDASKRDIKKAYRKLAQEWHPDKYTGDLNKQQVEKKMSEINMAYEVLSNDELREKYDHGEDPNDPMRGNGGGGGYGNTHFHGGPFYSSDFPGGGGGGFHFGGGGPNFRFNFG